MRPEAERLLGLTAELVDIPSVSHHEKAIADHVESWLKSRCESDVLELRRIGDNVCARTNSGLPERLIIAGHLDTVPPNGNERAVLEGEVLRGLGSADMKGGVALAMELARLASESSSTGLALDLTFLFYTCEEVEQEHSGLGQIEAEDPSWLEGDAAILGEPTGGSVEAGCQGVLNLVVEVRGERAHTARPWKGRNAIHRLAPVLAALSGYSPRSVTMDGCEYQEALQAVAVTGGVANNVVPDSAELVLNHRFAPDRTAVEAADALRTVFGPSIDPAAGDRLVVTAESAPAAPGLGHHLLASLVEATGRPPRGKLGWTDVSYFYSRGVPAANYGPGDSTLAHNAAEQVTGSDLAGSLEVLRRVTRL
jgi:succinyl-diaminopimelate desuccinylase